jgi:hypothetical protein
VQSKRAQSAPPAAAWPPPAALASKEQAAGARGADPTASAGSSSKMRWPLAQEAHRNLIQEVSGSTPLWPSLTDSISLEQPAHLDSKVRKLST